MNTPTPETDQWETYCDECYYHLGGREIYMWRLRRKTERGWRDGFHIHTGEEAKGLCDLLNKLERERNEWKSKYIQQNKDLGCEQMDPNGTIWDHAQTLQREIDELRRWTSLNGVIDLQLERDEARRQLDELKALLTKEQGAVTISRNGYVQEIERERDEAREIIAAALKALLPENSAQ